MSAIPADLRLASTRWRVALPALGLLLLGIVLLYRETAVAMVEIWSRSDTFAHAFLVLPISLWLVWRLRHRLARLTPRPQPWLLLPMLGAGLAWMVSDLVVVNAASQFAFVALLVLAVPAVLGLEVARVMTFPLLFLFFGVPFGEFMLPTMMDWTADFVVLALQWTGVPVFREGLQFVIPTGRWSIIDECSGVRYLMASFMVGTLFAYLNYRSYARRAAFMAVSIAMPILANWLRAYIIVMMGHLSGNRIAVGVDHILYGWVFFGIVIFAMFMIGMRWSEPDDPALARDDNLPPPTGPAAEPRGLALTAAAGLLVALAPHLATTVIEHREQSAAEPRLVLPETLAPGWKRIDKPALGWAPQWMNPSVVEHHAYAGPAGEVGVYVAYFRGQGADRKLVSSRNSVVGINDRTWNAVGRGSARLATPGGGELRAPSVNILAPDVRPGEHRAHIVAWRLYWIDGRFVTGDAPAKLANAASRLRGRGDDGAAIVLYADRAGFEASSAALQAFARDNMGALDELLQRTRDAR
jgi:exosortase A